MSKDTTQTSEFEVPAGPKDREGRTETEPLRFVECDACAQRPDKVDLCVACRDIKGRIGYLNSLRDTISSLWLANGAVTSPSRELLSEAAQRLADWEGTCEGNLGRARKARTAKPDRVGRTEATTQRLAADGYLQGVKHIVDELRQAAVAGSTSDGHLLLVAVTRMQDWENECADKLKRDEPCLGTNECGTYGERGGTCEGCEKDAERVSATKEGGDADAGELSEPVQLTEKEGAAANAPSPSWLDDQSGPAYKPGKDHHLDKPAVYNHVLVVVDMQVDYAPARDKDLQARIEAAADAHLGPVIKVQYDGAGEPTVELGLDIQTIWRDKNDAGDELYAWLLGAHLMTRDLKVAVCGVNLGACVRDTAVGLWHRLANEQGLTGCVSIVQGLCGDESGRVQFVPGIADAWGEQNCAAAYVQGTVAPGTTFAQWLGQQPPEDVITILGPEKGKRFLAGDVDCRFTIARKTATTVSEHNDGD